MAQTNNNSNKQANLDLSIQISLSGLSFCILNTDSYTIIDIREFRFEKRLNPLEVLDELKQLFAKEIVLNNPFNNVNHITYMHIMDYIMCIHSFKILSKINLLAMI